MYLPARAGLVTSLALGCGVEPSQVPCNHRVLHDERRRVADTRQRHKRKKVRSTCNDLSHPRREEEVSRRYRMGEVQEGAGERKRARKGGGGGGGGGGEWLRYEQWG